MDKIYQIQKIKSSNFQYSVISKYWYRIDDYIEDVAKELRDKKIIGNVLFDCLLSNGNSARFLIAHFDGKSFNYNSFKQITEIEDSVSESLEKVYRNNLEWIDGSILNDSQRFLLKKKLKSIPEIKKRLVSQ